MRENESYGFDDLMCFVKLNVRILIMKRKNLNAAMRCESAYTISKNKDLPMKTLSKIMKCDHETFLLRTSQWKRKPQKHL